MSIHHNLNKGISTPIAILVIMAAAVIGCGLALWQYSEIEKETADVSGTGEYGVAKDEFIEVKTDLSENAAQCLENLKKEENIISLDGLSPDKTKIIFTQMWRPVPDSADRPKMRVVNLKICKDIYTRSWLSTAGDNISGISWSSDSMKAAITMNTARGWIGRFVILSTEEGQEKTIFSLF